MEALDPQAGRVVAAKCKKRNVPTLQPVTEALFFCTQCNAGYSEAKALKRHSSTAHGHRDGKSRVLTRSPSLILTEQRGSVKIDQYIVDPGIRLAIMLDEPNCTPMGTRRDNSDYQ